MKPLSKAKREILDHRYTLYEPNVLVEGPETQIDVVCPLHGPYKAVVGKLRQKYTYYSLKPPQCPGCRHNRLDPNELRRRIKYAFRALAGYPGMESYLPAPEWVPLEIWKEPLM